MPSGSPARCPLCQGHTQLIRPSCTGSICRCQSSGGEWEEVGVWPLVAAGPEASSETSEIMSLSVCCPWGPRKQLPLRRSSPIIADTCSPALLLHSGSRIGGPTASGVLGVSAEAECRVRHLPWTWAHLGPRKSLTLLPQIPPGKRGSMKTRWVLPHPLDSRA